MKILDVTTKDIFWVGVLFGIMISSIVFSAVVFFLILFIE